MPSERRRKREQLAAYVKRVRPQVIGEREWAELLTEMAPVSERYLRGLLRESGVPLSPLVEGVRQDTLENLDRTLSALSDLYAAAKSAGNLPGMKELRRLVLTAKSHAKLASARGSDKAEPILRMLTWLGDPELYPQWARIRNSVLRGY